MVSSSLDRRVQGLNPVLVSPIHQREGRDTDEKWDVACYRKGGPLATTDANLLLGRLLPEYFPKIFGASENLPLDIEASRTAFEILRSEINAYVKEHGSKESKELTLDEVAFGYIKIANETMACVFFPSLSFTVLMEIGADVQFDR
jgi:N-methylhydantoinase A/oxoprolinase/acetone carboxylase beta subunit